ncbi:hypothetical protein GLOTRDRAFT_133931 [Gloeophyllum trabeum ATCC 11539]|uniref:Uncharacterized protein n=1 Tax=Gloeophyllum trabeum (strain ATCC 11539 / FP-39264 / Madison 617) TaxID=670483 RepID=S7PSI5_GLOTA|nr:uncharacterized protein GLOTRDRAFT_133931 [Gloeophyllum trabeum ATCC 11539]EPQ50378.1 hypothetical protein GLOTRDRAFT_133931 [Gloeophyllum trabeum ATCC 11539]
MARLIHSAFDLRSSNPPRPTSSPSPVSAPLLCTNVHPSAFSSQRLCPAPVNSPAQVHSAASRHPVAAPGTPPRTPGLRAFAAPSAPWLTIVVPGNCPPVVAETAPHPSLRAPSSPHQASAPSPALHLAGHTPCALIPSPHVHKFALRWRRKHNAARGSQSC